MPGGGTLGNKPEEGGLSDRGGDGFAGGRVAWQGQPAGKGPRFCS